MKCPKMGPNGQIFASLLAKKVALKRKKHLIMLKETPSNWIIWCIEFTLNDL